MKHLQAQQVWDKYRGCRFKHTLPEKLEMDREKPSLCRGSVSWKLLRVQGESLPETLVPP